jgi:hypothetical protein
MYDLGFRGFAPKTPLLEAIVPKNNGRGLRGFAPKAPKAPI